MAAIECLRKYYTEEELENTFNFLNEKLKENKEAPKIFKNTPEGIIRGNKPFKEDYLIVSDIDVKHNFN